MPITADHEEQLDLIIAEYLRGVAHGTAPAHEELLGRYPEFANDLRSFFADRAELERLAGPLRQTIAVPVGFTLPRDFGPYRLVGELGRGGMGVVYQALEQSVGRTVAVKVLQQGPLATDEDRLRLRLEAEAIARMGYHPNIVPLLDVGSVDGHAYLAMQLIRGPNLATIKQRFRSHPRAVADLVATLAETVQHAHLHGIAHRDLKPSNILLAVPAGAADDPGSEIVLPLADYRPVVSDFGLARVLMTGSAERLTLSGAVLGTPAYMAPEQARGEEATLAVDIYGLGAILYELLAGRPPHQGAPLEVLRKVCDEEPVPPRFLNPAVPRDLENICLKCLAKEPAKRYVSGRDLAEDLRAYLEGRPVSARPVGIPGRLWRWARRQPLAAGLLVVVGLLVFGSIAGMTSLWLRAEANFQRAELEGQEAERNFQLAHEVVRDFCLRYADEADQTGRPRAEAREPLERALGYYTRFLERHADHPDLRAELAEAHDLIGKLHLTLGDRLRGVASLESARTLIARLQAEQPDEPRWMRRLVGLTANLGTLQQNTLATQTYFTEALALTDRFLAIRPDDVDLRGGKAHLLANLGAFHEKRGEREAARRSYETARDLLRALRVGHPERESLMSDLAFALVNLGALRSHEQDGLGDALAALEEARPLRERLLEARPLDARRQAELASILHKHAVFLRDARETKRSREAFDQALKLQKSLVDQHPQVVRYQADLAATLKQVGFNLDAAGNRPAALDHYRQAVDRFERVVQAAPEEPGYRRDLGLAWISLGLLHGAMNQRAEERAAFERARIPLEWLLKKDDRNVDAHHHMARALHGLAFNLYVGKQAGEALTLLGEALAHSRLVLDSAPKVPAYRQAIDLHYLLAADIHWKNGDVMRSLTMIRERQALWPENAQRLYHSGREIARLFGVSNLSPQEVESLWTELASALRAASAAGFRDWERIQREPEWETIRAMKRLAVLLASLG